MAIQSGVGFVRIRNGVNSRWNGAFCGADADYELDATCDISFIVKTGVGREESKFVVVAFGEEVTPMPESRSAQLRLDCVEIKFSVRQLVNGDVAYRGADKFTRYAVAFADGFYDELEVVLVGGFVENGINVKICIVEEMIYGVGFRIRN